jgi:hypothetical protein
MTTYKFTVTGRVPFPVDMLRYDGCNPADSESAATIEASIHHERPPAGGLWSVRLISNRRPTYGRWKSFLWTASDEQRM